MFIVDTNVLLNLYRYQTKTSDELLTVLKRISDRLWIPFQVGLEYQENRLKVIDEQVEIFHKVQQAITKGKEALEQNLHKLQLGKRHSFIDPTLLLNRIQIAITDFQQELEHLQTQQPSIFDPDKLREEIDTIFEGKIGQPPISQEVLDTIYKEGEQRYAQKCPPGYMDIDKDKELQKRGERTAYLYEGLSIERKYGDLILWYQIIEEAKSNDKMKKIIYVTGDIKEDWWYKIDRFGFREEAIIGARPELVQEISSKTGVVTFYMYQTDVFLLHANKYLGTQTSTEAVEQVRNIAQSEEESVLSSREFEVLKLMHQGKKYKEIADELLITERTVKFHVGSICRKLGASNGKEAVFRATTQGLLSFSFEEQDTDESDEI